jgi:hypothetical protein
MKVQLVHTMIVTMMMCVVGVTASSSSSSGSSSTRPQWHVYQNNPNGTRFCFDATWSVSGAFETCVQMFVSPHGLYIDIEAKSDTIQENAYVKCNDDLYNQEVVEVFISNETMKASPEHYWEIEVSPRDFVWLGYDYNPDGDRHNLSHTYYPCDRVSTKVENYEDSWKASLFVSMDMLGQGSENCDDGHKCHHYRANFFRVQMIPSIWKPYKGHVTRDQVCSPDNCTFSCANRPDTPEPDFHQTKYFGDLYLHFE